MSDVISIILPDPVAGFERLFQRFMNGEFTYVHEEDWDRYYAALHALKKDDSNHCKHGKTKLTCPDCYFGT